MNIGIISLLTVVFVVLKLCGVVTWSWWLVLSPIWVSLLAAGFLFFSAVAWIYANDRDDE